MLLAFDLARALSIGAFLFYGAACLVTPRMILEFERYGLARFRRLVGALQLLGAFGLLAGFAFRPLLIAAAGGLSLLMLLGVATRIRIRDSLLQTLPALVFFALNGFVLVVALLERDLQR